MKKLNIPKIKIGKLDKIWIERLYYKIKQNEKIDYKIMRVELIKDLPLNFDPHNIDNRLVKYNGMEITLLGVYHIDPNSHIFEKTNMVINKIRDFIIKEPEIKTIEAVTIAKETKLEEAEIALILSIISPYGKFWNNATLSINFYGYSSIKIEDEEIFRQYITFTSFEEIINKYYEEDIRIKKLSSSKEILELSSDESENTLKINPIFKTKITHIDSKIGFVLMPFTEEWSNRVYRNFIRENIEALGLQCLRADNLKGPIIIEDIWTQINQAAFIIADVTNKNPNVMYELGIAHTIGKPVVLITQDIKNIPFDFTHLRHYAYEDNSDGKDKFGATLKEIITEIYRVNYPKIKLKV